MNNYQSYTDESLFALISSDDPDAFHEIFQRYRDRLYSVGLKMTKSHPISEEMVQECFISLWKSRSGLLQVRKADAYIFRIIYNRVRKYLKTESNRQKILRDAAVFQITIINNTEDGVNLKDRKQMIENAMQAMTAQQRAIFELARIKGLSVTEIANLLSLSPNTVKSHLSSALRIMRTHMTDMSFILLALQLFEAPFHSC